MKELDFFELRSDQMPEDLEALQAALKGAGLRGEYKVIDDMLGVECDRGRFLFAVVPAFDGPIPNPSGIDVAADIEDRAATMVYLTEIFKAAMPGRRG